MCIQKTYDGKNMTYQVIFFLNTSNNLNIDHCVKSVKIWSFFWSLFSRIRTEYGEISRIQFYVEFNYSADLIISISKRTEKLTRNYP